MPYIGNITQDFNVSNAMLDTDSVTSIKIVDGTIEGADIAANLDLSDNQKIRFGTGNDLEIYHDGSNSIVFEGGTGTLKLATAGGSVDIVKGADSSETMAKFLINGAVELYHNNVKKFETTADGVTTNGVTVSTGNIQINNDTAKIRLGASQDLELYHNGSNSFIVDNGTGNLYIRGDDTLFIQSASGEDKLKATTNGSVELYYDNSKKFETDSNGVTVTGQLRFTDDNSIIVRPTSSSLAFNTGGSERLRINSSGHIKLPDTKQLQFGGALNSGDGDLQIYHDGSHSYITNTGTGHLYIIDAGIVKIQSDSFKVDNADGTEQVIKANPNAGVEIYYDNSKKFETTGAGVSITGNLDLPDNTSGNASLRLGNSQDFFMNHNGTDSFIINNTGDLYIRDLNGDVHIQGKDSEESIIAKADGAVELYYNNGKRFETSSSGATVSGELTVTSNLLMGDGDKLRLGDSNDLELHHSGGENYIQGHLNQLYIRSAQGIYIQPNTNENGVVALANGAAELYHNNVKRITTRSGGGAQDGAVIYGNSSNVAINLFTDTSERGTVYANSSNQVGFLDSGGDWAIKHTNDSQTEFYVGTNRKAAIDADGLKFNNDTAAANALDDYEEGTYTATLTPATSGSVTLSSSHETLKYTKVGRLVALTGRVNIASISSPQGALRINLPFTNATEGADHSAYTNCSVFSHEINTVDNTIGMMVEISPGNSHGTIFQVRDAVSWSGLDGSQLTSGSGQWLTFTIHFFTNT